MGECCSNYRVVMCVVVVSTMGECCLFCVVVSPMGECCLTYRVVLCCNKYYGVVLYKLQGSLCCCSKYYWVVLYNLQGSFVLLYQVLLGCVVQLSG